MTPHYIEVLVTQSEHIISPGVRYTSSTTPSVQVHRAPKKKLYDLGGLRLDESAPRFPSKSKLNLEINHVISVGRFG